MQIGVDFVDFSLPGGPAGLRAVIGATAVAAEEAGVDWFTTMDHCFQVEQLRTAHDAMLEGYSVLSFVAAKTVTTLDVLSGGRAFLGIGAAWYEREHLALGVPCPPSARRGRRRRGGSPGGNARGGHTGQQRGGRPGQRGARAGRA